jgi:hypothetical protein
MNFVTLQRTFLTYKQTFELTFQNQIEMESPVIWKNAVETAKIA